MHRRLEQAIEERLEAGESVAPSEVPAVLEALGSR